MAVTPPEFLLRRAEAFADPLADLFGPFLDPLGDVRARLPTLSRAPILTSLGLTLSLSLGLSRFSRWHRSISWSCKSG
jgi:hypothetical protein